MIDIPYKIAAFFYMGGFIVGTIFCSVIYLKLIRRYKKMLDDDDKLFDSYDKLYKSNK